MKLTSNKDNEAYKRREKDQKEDGDTVTERRKDRPCQLACVNLRISLLTHTYTHTHTSLSHKHNEGKEERV